MNDKELYSPEYFKSYSLECNPFKADSFTFAKTLKPIDSSECVMINCGEY